MWQKAESMEHLVKIELMSFSSETSLLTNTSRQSVQLVSNITLKKYVVLQTVVRLLKFLKNAISLAKFGLLFIFWRKIRMWSSFFYRSFFLFAFSWTLAIWRLSGGSYFIFTQLRSVRQKAELNLGKLLTPIFQFGRVLLAFEFLATVRMTYLDHLSSRIFFSLSLIFTKFGLVRHSHVERNKNS